MVPTIQHIIFIENNYHPTNLIIITLVKLVGIEQKLG